MVRRLLTGFVLVAANTDAAFLRGVVLTALKKNHALKTALALRGGAGPLDVKDTAKFATALNLGNAGVTVLAPKLGCKVYGMPQSPLLEYQIECFGATLLSIALASYCLLFCQTTVNTAIGVASFPLAIQCTKELLNDTPRELGIPIEPSIICLAIAVFSARALLTNAPYASKVLRFLSLWSLVNGIFQAVAPKIAGQAWGVIKIDAHDMNVMLVKLHGYFNTALGVLIGSLDRGVDATKAVGYSWIPYLSCSLDVNFISKQVDMFGLRKDLQYVWLLLMATFVFTLA